MKLRRIGLSCLLVLAMALVCVFTLPTEAKAESFTEGDYTYTVENGEATIVGYNGVGGDVTIPSTLGGYTVTEICGKWHDDGSIESAFISCSNLTSITIPSGVTAIGSYAFAWCDNLTTVTIPDSVTSVGKSVFYACGNLQYNIYDNGKYLGNSNNPYLYLAESTSISITSISVHNATRFIGDYAFEDCTKLGTVAIGNNVTFIGDGAFSSCDGVTDIYITDPNAWCNIEFNSDRSNPVGDKSRVHVLDANGVEVTEVVLDNSVQKIPSRAFFKCYNLTSIKIPKSVSTIGVQAFSGCSQLTRATIPDGVIIIDRHAFSDCSRLTEAYIGANVTAVGEYAFYNCSSLQSVTIGDSVTTIGGYAFYNCDSLTSVTIGNSVTNIGDSAFYDCDRLSSIAIPDSVTTIGKSAFYSCYSLASITIPDSVTTISNYAFYSCSSLTNVYYTGSQSQWNTISIGSNNYKLTGATIHYQHVHDYSIIPAKTVAATCTEDGYTEYTCSFGEKYRETIPALGHSKGNDPQTINPTCTERGYTQTTCTRCGGTEKSAYVDALGHDYSGKVTVVTPTCTEQGYTATQCTRCADVEKTDYTDSLGHKMIYAPAVDPTCTEKGRTEGTECERCGLIGVGTILTALGHDMVDANCILPSTCTVCGETEGSALGHDMADATCTLPKTCTVCGDTTGEALGHTSDSGTTTKKATCTATGTKTYKCTRCKATVKTVTLAKLGHNYSDATCTTAKTCTRCKKTSGDPLDHTYDSGKTTKNATCKATGIKTYTCKCGATKTSTIAKLTTHTYTNACDTSCNVCKAKRTITHKYKTTTTKATATKDGKIVKKCSVCKTTTTTVIRKASSVKLSATSYTYNGKVKTPTVTVKDSAGKTLKKNTDYTVKYASGRENVGTYKVTITFKGKYSGTKVLTFKIVPKAASINKLTAKTKAIAVKINRSLKQSSGYQIQYATSKSFKSYKTTNITKYTESTKTISGLKAKTTYYVRVRTYKTVGGVKIYSNWSTAKNVKTK